MSFVLIEKIKSINVQLRILLARANNLLFVKEDKFINLFAILLLVAGLYLGFHTNSLLGVSNYSFGQHTISLMVPLSFSMLYIGFSAYKQSLSPLRYITAILLFSLLSLPLVPFLKDPITYPVMDDGWRYSIYAKNMIENQTLWGSDGLIHEGLKEFIDQPGYRYWVALSRLIFGFESRGMQLFNLAIYLIISLLFIYKCNLILDQKDHSIIPIFLSLSSPYACKNILMGLSEWLTVILFLTYIILLIDYKPLFSTLTLSLIPFIRQNLLVLVVILMIISIIYFRKSSLIISFLIMIGLPIYHNLYYAQKFQYLAGHFSNNARSWQYYDGLTPRSLLAVFFRFMEYFGYEGSTNLMSLLLAWLFVPLGTFLIIYQFYIRKNKYMILPIMILLSTILPTLIFGFAYYPRFVYVNQIIILTSILVFSSNHFRASLYSKLRNYYYFKFAKIN